MTSWVLLNLRSNSDYRMQGTLFLKLRQRLKMMLLYLPLHIFIATRAGWEDDPLVFQWLDRAAELSDDDGPLQKVSLTDILERKPEWGQSGV